MERRVTDIQGDPFAVFNWSDPARPIVASTHFGGNQRRGLPALVNTFLSIW
jgi:hypothetical protein